MSDDPVPCWTHDRIEQEPTVVLFGYQEGDRFIQKCPTRHAYGSDWWGVPQF